MSNILEIRDLQVHYGGIEAVKGISLDVPEGEIVTLIGANGAGKSSTLRSIAGLVKPSAGNISFLGEDITARDTNLIVSKGITLVPEGRTYRDDIVVIKVPATDIAAELKNERGTNIVMLGALACASPLYDEEKMRQAVEHYFAKKGKNNPKNAMCFDRGADAARSQL